MNREQFEKWWVSNIVTQNLKSPEEWAWMGYKAALASQPPLPEDVAELIDTIRTAYAKEHETLPLIAADMLESLSRNLTRLMEEHVALVREKEELNADAAQYRRLRQRELVSRPKSGLVLFYKK